jgi:hypothetical protein
VQRLTHLAARTPGLQPIQHVQHRVHVLGGRRHVLDDLAVERDEPDAVALVMHEVGQAGREDARVIELGDAAAAVVHRLRHVQQHREVHVGLGFVFLDVVAVGARPEAPVHAADVVARDVAAVLGEVHRGAEVRRLVQPVDEAVAHGAGDEVQVPDAREHNRIHETRAGNRSRRVAAQQAHSAPPTSNAQRPTPKNSQTFSWELEVGSWELTRFTSRSAAAARR